MGKGSSRGGGAVTVETRIVLTLKLYHGPPWSYVCSLGTGTCIASSRSSSGAGPLPRQVDRLVQVIWFQAECVLGQKTCALIDLQARVAEPVNERKSNEFILTSE